MATKKISELEAISEAASDDVLAIVDVSETETRKITKGNLLVGAGHTIEMSLNSATYTLTLSLKNEAGTVLNTQTIDLPNENALTNITYSNGILTLTKQNGETSTVDISGLVSGLLSETTFNAFVTEIEEIIGISTDTYRTTSTYNTGDIVIYNGKIYKCNNNNVTGTFDDTKWDEISLYEYQKLQDQKIENKVEKENGKGLSTNDYTTAEKNKLSGIETGAEVNAIESVKVNGTVLTPTDKEVDVPVPNKTSDLTNDSGFGTYTKPSGGIPKTDLASDVQTSLGKADTAVQEEHKTGSQEEYKVLSDNNYTDDEKGKLANLENYDDSDITERVDGIEEEQETQNEDIEKLQDKVANQQKIVSQMPKVSGEGTELTLNNTIEAEFAEFLPEGNTEQETTNGYQLFDKDNASTFYGYPSPSAKKLVVGGNTDKCLYLPIENNQTYMIQKKVSSRFYVGTCEAIENGISVSNAIGNNSANNLTVTSGANDNYLVVCYFLNGTETNEQEIINSIMIEKGTVAHSWEKYTGGIASPNMDYPQERYSAGVNGSITEKIVNKNWLKLKASQDNTTTNNINLRVYVNEGKVTLNGTPSTTFNFLIGETTLLPGTYSMSGCPTGGSWNNSYGLLLIAGSTSYADYGNGKTFTVEEKTNFQLMVRVSSSYTFNNFIFYPQIESGSTIHPFVAHQEQTYTIPVQQEMRSIGTVRDEFVKNNVVWYERHNVARVIFDGTETFALELSNEKIKQFRTPQNFLTNLLITPDPFAQLGNSASNYFIKLSNANALTDKGFTLNGNKQVIFNTEFTTVAELKAWLAEQYANGTPVYVDYIVAEPLDLPCTQEQIDVLQNLPETYNEQTNVLSEDSVPAIVKASGYLDLNTLVSRIAQLETEV